MNAASRLLLPGRRRWGRAGAGSAGSEVRWWGASSPAAAAQAGAGAGSAGSVVAVAGAPARHQTPRHQCHRVRSGRAARVDTAVLRHARTAAVAADPAYAQPIEKTYPEINSHSNTKAS